MVPADDLARLAYRGDRSQMESDLRNLSRQGLIEQHSIEGHSSYSTGVLTLTKDGYRLLERAQLVSNRQAIYHGLVKPKEARHDADLYRHGRGEVQGRGARGGVAEASRNSDARRRPGEIRAFFFSRHRR